MSKRKYRAGDRVVIAETNIDEFYPDGSPYVGRRGIIHETDFVTDEYEYYVQLDEGNLLWCKVACLESELCQEEPV